MYSENEINRIWEGIEKKGINDCWPWKKRINQGGYGTLTIGGRKNPKTKTASRMLWEIIKGPIPRKFFVLHKCDNRICMNPKHLFLGTKRDNALDCVAKGRSGLIGERNPMKRLKGIFTGEKHPNSVLTDELVIRLRKRYNDSKNKWGIFVRLSKEFGISLGATHDAISGDTWRHLPAANYVPVRPRRQAKELQS